MFLSEVLAFVFPWEILIGNYVLMLRFIVMATSLQCQLCILWREKNSFSICSFSSWNSLQFSINWKNYVPCVWSWFIGTHLYTEPMNDNNMRGEGLDWVKFYPTICPYTRIKTTIHHLHFQPPLHFSPTPISFSFPNAGSLHQQEEWVHDPVHHSNHQGGVFRLGSHSQTRYDILIFIYWPTWETE